MAAFYNRESRVSPNPQLSQRKSQKTTHLSNDVDPVVVMPVPPSVEIRLTPRHGVALSQFDDVFRSAVGDFARLREVDESRKRTVFDIHRVGGVDRADDEGDC